MSEMENFNNTTFYLNNISNNLESIIELYLKLVKIYLSLFKKNITTKKKYYIKYIYKKGLMVLKNIFLIILANVNNTNFTYYHCEKGIYYYTEFISQIENENSFLKLNTNDAVIFVYKKTIYNINKKLVKNINYNKIKEINKIITFIEKFINEDNINLLENNLQVIITNIDLIESKIIFRENMDTNVYVEELKNLLTYINN
jgi:hypothetical protein